MYELLYNRRRHVPKGLAELASEGILAKYEEVGAIRMVDKEDGNCRNGKKNIRLGFRIGVHDPRQQYTLDNIFYGVLERMLARVSPQQREGILDGLELYEVTSNGSKARKPSVEEMSAYKGAVQRLKGKKSET